MMLPQHTRVYLATGHTDMRKAINGLAIMVQNHMALDPFAGQLFAFCNRRRSMVKILYWDRNGFCLWQKRLERDKFIWPESRRQVMALDARQLHWLLEGLGIQQSGAHKSLQYCISG